MLFQSRQSLWCRAKSPRALVEFQICIAYKSDAMEGPRLLEAIRLEPAMTIQCPSCKRTGTLPDEMLSTPHTVRCRKCLARFSIGPQPALPTTNPQPKQTIESPAARFTGERPAPSGADSPNPGARIHPPPPVVNASEGSHYELPALIDDLTDGVSVREGDESGAEIAAFPIDAHDSSDEIPSCDGDPPSDEIAILNEVPTGQRAVGAVRNRKSDGFAPGGSTRPGF